MAKAEPVLVPTTQGQSARVAEGDPLCVSTEPDALARTLDRPWVRA